MVSDASARRVGELASQTDYRAPRQNDGRRNPDLGAERHVWSDRWRPPLWMKRECPQRRMGTEPWAILHRHPLGPEVAEDSVAPWLV